MDKDLSRQHIRRDVLRLLKNNGQKLFRPKEISRQLGYSSNREYRLFRDVLSEMEDQGVIGRVKGGRYGYRPRPNRIEGTLRVNPQGFGFVETDVFDDDLFVSEGNMATALDGDRVLVGVAAPARGDRRRECEVIKVLERKRTETVGTFKQTRHFAFVDPDDPRITVDIYVPAESFNGAKDGDKVVVSIDRFEDRKASPEGRVLKVIGPASDPNVRVLSLALSMDVRAEFPPGVEEDAARIPVEIPQSEIDRRLDLRDKRVFTIDPVDAKDFDDAIHIEALPGGDFELGVHIADVSHYVQRGTPIDREAYERGTSTYLVDRVIPMLPEKLSNNVCSLRPDEDKLTYSCIMRVNPKGRVTGYEIRETIIRSKYRFTYEGAQEVIEGKDPENPFAPDLALAAQLASTLTKKRMREGSIDFDMPEVRIVLDENFHPTSILRRDRKESNRLIEEFMLLANQTVARHIGAGKKAPPFVYRIHDKPDPERIAQLAEYVRAFGYSLKLNKGEVDSGALSKLLEQIKDSPEAPVIEEAALRAMAKAKYSTGNIGHYGLAFDYYTHFTSPIRRYPDLMVHRLLKHYSTGGAPVNEIELENQAVHCSERERVAADAERESIRLKQVEYIRDHLGERFTGVISGVTKFGIYVELSDILVEGMVHVRDMDDDYYVYDERTYRLMGEHTGRTFKLGKKVDVVVAAANLETRQVDLLLAE